MSAIAQVYVTLIKKKLKTIEQVPEIIKEDVKELLESDEK